MKKDLFIVAALIVVAALGIGGIVVLPYLNREDDEKKSIAPKPERIAELPKPKPPIKKPIVVEQKRDEDATPVEKKIEPIKKPDDDKVPTKKAEAKLEPKKIDEKPEPQIAVKLEPKKEVKNVAKVVVLGETVRLRDPDGEYALAALNNGDKAVFVGEIKTLRIAELNQNSTLDTSALEAEEIVFTGNINGSKVTLGKTQTLKIRDVNGKSLLDASASGARDIVLQGSVNSGSTVKLGAGPGTIEIFGAVNDRSRLEIDAPDSKVVFKGPGDIVNGGTHIVIRAKQVEFLGPINGPQTEVTVTLTKTGSLMSRRVNGGVRLHYAKAAASDPPPRIERGDVAPQAQFLEVPSKK